MRLLAIDTALGLCSACVFDTETNTALASESIEMSRGHAEALMPLIERVVSQIDGEFTSLDRVAVSVGPGSFTGLRVALAAGRIRVSSNSLIVSTVDASALSKNSSSG